MTAPPACRGTSSSYSGTTDRSPAARDRAPGAPITIDGHRLHPTAGLGPGLAGPTLHGPTLLTATGHAMYEGKQLRQATTIGESPASITRLYRDPTRRHRSTAAPPPGATRPG